MKAVKPILKAYHNDEMLVHPRTKAMQSMLRRRFFWPSMNTDIREHVRRCSVCDRTCTGRRLSAVRSKTLLVQEPCTVVSIDLYGELPKGKDGMVYGVLSMQCPMSRYCLFAALPDKSAKTVAKAFHKTWIMRFGAPKVILSDSGGEFTSIDENTIAHLEEEYRDMCTPHRAPSLRVFLPVGGCFYTPEKNLPFSFYIAQLAQLGPGCVLCGYKKRCVAILGLARWLMAADGARSMGVCPMAHKFSAPWRTGHP